MFPLHDSIPTRFPPLAVWFLVFSSALVFAFELRLSEREIQSFFYLFGLVPARYTHPEWAQSVGFPVGDYWPFITSMFLHGGWMHIIGNMWFLWLFGDNVEDRMGSIRFLLFYLSCGLIAALVQIFVNPESTLPTVGASGAIAGVLGAYFVMYPRAQVVVMIPILFYPFIFALPAALFLAFWFLMQFLSGTSALFQSAEVGGVAWWAHVGGFVAGALLHRLFFSAARIRRFRKDEIAYRSAWKRRL